MAQETGVIAAVEPGETGVEVLSETDIRHNVRVNVLLDAIFCVGAADSALAAAPLYVYLGATNTQIGMMGSLGVLALVGVFLSPFISRRCPRKKWYLLISHFPYIGAQGVLGLGIILSAWLGIGNPGLLSFVFAINAATMFFSGFVTLPHFEFLAACIPMSHRGRYTGFSLSIGSVGSIVSSAIGGYILWYATKPMAFGYLFVMMWAICQGGYLMALFAREPRTPVENSPKPWTRDMIEALVNDKPFLKVLGLNLLFYNIINPALTFVPIYGFRVLSMAAATAATMAIIQQIIRAILSAPIGVWTDRYSAKRLLPIWYVTAALSLVPLLVVRHPLAVYVSSGLIALTITGINAAFNPLLFGVPAPENRSGHFSTQIILRNLLDAAGMFMVGVLLDHFSFRSIFAVWVVVGLAFAAVAVRWMATLSADARDYA